MLRHNIRAYHTCLNLVWNLLKIIIHKMQNKCSIFFFHLHFCYSKLSYSRKMFDSTLNSYIVNIHLVIFIYFSWSSFYCTVKVEQEKWSCIRHFKVILDLDCCPDLKKAMFYMLSNEILRLPSLVKILHFVSIRWNKIQSYTEKIKYPLCPII